MKRLLSALLLAIASLALAAPALAEDGGPTSIGDAVEKLLESANLRTAPPQPADFVVRSRPAELDYVPLATPGAGRRTEKKSAKQLREMEDEFGAAAAANRARAARVKIPDPRQGAARASAAQRN